MVTDTQLNNLEDLLEICAFSEGMSVTGVTYYDEHSRAFCIIRLPARIRELYPQIRHRKIRFEIHCFPNIKMLKDHIEKTNSVPLIINLFARENDNKAPES
jgi:hypothetical protein